MVILMGVKIIDKDLGWKKIIKEMRKFNRSYTAVGWFGSGDSPKDNLAARMAVHEYGSPKKNIPSRPVNAQTFEKNKNKIPKIIDKLVSKIIEKKWSAKRALTFLGAWYTGQIKDMFIKGNFQGLGFKIIKRKGSSKPLIDTGQMRNSVTHREVMK